MMTRVLIPMLSQDIENRASRKRQKRQGAPDAQHGQEDRQVFGQRGPQEVQVHVVAPWKDNTEHKKKCSTPHSCHTLPWWSA